MVVGTEIDICMTSVDRVTMCFGHSTMVTLAIVASETTTEGPNGFSIYLPFDTYFGHLIM